MAKKRSMTRNRNHDDASSKTWSQLDHDVLSVVMMKLGVIDFVSFSGIYKSWRSFALANRKMFMASRPPMPMWISNHVSEKECYCHLEDFEGRKFKTLIPHSFGRTSVGLTCGYLVLFGKETKDFWLVNPITRHQLHFPNFPLQVDRDILVIKVILVFSPSISGWVFIFLNKFSHKLWFSIAGKGAWNLVSTTFHIVDLHVFKGKLYVLDKYCRLFIMRLNPNPKLKLLDINNCLKPNFLFPEIVNSGENLFVMDHGLQYKVEEVDFGKMIWVKPEKTCAFFISNLNYPLAINPVSWVEPRLQYQRQADSTNKGRKYKLFTADMWYFPHCCVDDNLLHER